MYSYGPPHMAVQKQDDQHEHTFSSYVRIRDVALKTCLGRWAIGRSGERGSGISVLPARHDDDDILWINCNVFFYIVVDITFIDIWFDIFLILQVRMLWQKTKTMKRQSLKFIAFIEHKKNIFRKFMQNPSEK